MTPPMERIQILESIEKEITSCLQSAGQAFVELSKEKSSLKQAEAQTQQFLKSLGLVESRLSEQINYLTQVSTGQPHEGSGYASQKVLQMAWHRLEHARSRVNELERIKNKSRWTRRIFHRLRVFNVCHTRNRNFVIEPNHLACLLAITLVGDNLGCVRIWARAKCCKLSAPLPVMRFQRFSKKLQKRSLI